MTPASGTKNPQAIGLEKLHFRESPVISDIEPVISETSISNMDSTLTANLYRLGGGFALSYQLLTPDETT